MKRMSLRARKAALGLAVIAALGLTACSGSTGAATTSKSQEANEVSMAFRTPNWILPISAPGFTQGENAIFGSALYRPLYNYDLTSDAEFSIYDAKSLGETPVFSDDGKTMTITLKDAVWSDGEPITTRDVEFWWNLVTNNTEKWASYREGGFPDNIEAFKIIDEKTFSFTTTQAYSPSWFVGNQLNKVSIMPQHHWDKKSADGEIGDFDRDAAGAAEVFDYLTEQSKDLSTYATNELWDVVSGPWTIDSYVPNGQVELVPNEAYWGDDKAELDRVILRPFTGDDAQFNVLRAGEIDYGYVPAANMSQTEFMEKKGYTVDPWYGWSVTYMPMNFTNEKTAPLFNQKYIRQALQMLIDQETLSEKVWGGIAAPTCGPVPQSPEDMGTMNGCAYDFDPAGAQKLLEDHGWKIVPDGTSVCEAPGEGENQCGAGVEKGAKLELNLVSQSGFAASTKMMAQIKSEMSHVGILMNIQEVPDSVSVTQPCEAGTDCSWDLSFFGSQGSWYYPVYASGERIFQTGAPVNLGGYSNAEADKLIEATQFSSDDSALKAYNEFLAEELPVLWMPNPVYQVSAYNAKLQGIAPQDPMNLMYPEDWSWAK